MILGAGELAVVGGCGNSGSWRERGHSAMLLAAGLVVYSGPPSTAAAALAGIGCPVPPGEEG